MARPAGGYSRPDGTPVIGVTTILNELAKPALVGWAGKTVAAEAVTYIKRAWEAGRAGRPAPAFPRWGHILYGKRDKAAADGTAAHDLFERHLNGEDVLRNGASDGAWTAYENARHWLATTGLEFQVWPHERPLVHPELPYAGTPDALAMLSGVTYLADWKTGGLYPEMACQMAAYRELLRACENVEVGGCHLVRFHRESGDFAHHYMASDALDDGWHVFSALLELKGPMENLRARFK